MIHQVKIGPTGWTWQAAIDDAGFLTALRHDDCGDVVRLDFDLRNPDYTAKTSSLLEQERQHFAKR